MRTTLKSDDVPAALRSSDEDRQKALIRRELDEVSSAIKAISQRLGDSDEKTTRSFDESRESVEKLRSAMRKIVEIVNSERQENKELAIKVDRNEKAAVETEISYNRRIETISAEIVEITRDIMDGIGNSRAAGDEKKPLGSHGEPSEGGGNQLALFRQVGNLESRIEASESTNQRQEATIQGHIAEVKGEISDLKTLCRASRDGARGAIRSRSSSVEPSGWRERLDGIRQNVDEVSASTGKTREDTRKLAERIEIRERENVQLRENVRAAYLEVKRVDIAMSSLTQKNDRLNDRIINLVNLGGGIEEDKAAPAAGLSTLPAMPADGQHSLGQNTPAPSVSGGPLAVGRDRPRGRDTDSVTLGSGGLMGADYRQRREQCDLCGKFSEERDMHPCPRCKNRICTSCSPGYGACPICDNDARYERNSDAGPVGGETIPGNSHEQREHPRKGKVREDHYQR